MKIRSIMDKINLRRNITLGGLLVLIIFAGIAISTNMFGNISKTKAYDISDANRYFLDGWEMKNDNILGRVAPTTQLPSDQPIVIGGGISQRFDNSEHGFLNSPLFASVDSADPAIVTMHNTDGRTAMQSLMVQSGSAVTTTPLDFLYSLKDGKGINQDDNGNGFGLRMTGYYYNTADVAALEFTAEAKNGCKIQAYYGGIWNTVSNDYTAHNTMRYPVGALTPINYTHDTFLPLRISYYHTNMNNANTAGMTLFASVDGGTNWVIPEIGETSIVGRFFTGPDMAYPEGFITDYYVNNGQAKSYVVDTPVAGAARVLNPFSSRSGGTFSGDADFKMDNFRFSFIDTQYLKSFNATYNGGCYFTRNHQYATLPDPSGPPGLLNDDNYCAGYGQVFIQNDGYFVNQRPLTDELYSLDASDEVTEWKGGRSRLVLDVAGVTRITGGSAINLKGTGWPGGMPPGDESKTPGGKESFFYSNTNSKGKGGAVSGGGMLLSGGWQDGVRGKNGYGGGGAFGGFGDAAEFWPAHDGQRYKYGGPLDVEYLGSGGGASADVLRMGGAGGGLLILSTANLVVDDGSKISAIGETGWNESGAGSGGGIHIKLTSPTSFGNSPEITADGGVNTLHWLSLNTNANPPRYDGQTESLTTPGLGFGGGGRILIEGQITSGGINNITARAGCAKIYPAGCGSRGGDPKITDPAYWSTDGTVIINGAVSNSIKKKLVAKKRAGVINTTFNPYAVQKGDEIQVEITVGMLQAGVPSSITDETLNIPGKTTRCKPIAASDVPTATSLSANEVIWSNFMPTENEQIFSYHCLVQ